MAIFRRKTHLTAPSTAAKPSTAKPAAAKPAAAEPPPVPIDPLLGDADAHRFRAQLADGKWQDFHDFLLGSPTWRYRDFYACRLIPDGDPRGWVDDWVNERPDSSIPLFFRGRNKTNWAWEARGSGRAKTVGEDAWPVFYQRLVDADRDLSRAAAVDPRDPLPCAHSIWVAMGLSLGQQEIRRRDAEAERRDHLNLNACIAMVQAIARKWAGSHEEMFEFARSVSAQAPEGHSTHKVIALAHLERWLDLPKESRPGYFRDEEVKTEVRRAADLSIGSARYGEGLFDPVDRNPFAMCFYLMRDYPAQLEQMRLIGPNATDAPWHYLGKAGRAYARARHEALRATGADTAAP